jgi:hypothetical protein
MRRQRPGRFREVVADSENDHAVAGPSYFPSRRLTFLKWVATNSSAGPAMWLK